MTTEKFMKEDISKIWDVPADLLKETPAPTIPKELLTELENIAKYF